MWRVLCRQKFSTLWGKYQAWGKGGIESIWEKGIILRFFVFSSRPLSGTKLKRKQVSNCSCETTCQTLDFIWKITVWILQGKEGENLIINWVSSYLVLCVEIHSYLIFLSMFLTISGSQGIKIVSIFSLGHFPGWWFSPQKSPWDIPNINIFQDYNFIYCSIFCLVRYSFSLYLSSWISLWKMIIWAPNSSQRR